MTISQGFLLSQRAEASPQSPNWYVNNQSPAGILMLTSDTNFNSIFPGSDDFCWEAWINPINVSFLGNNLGLIVGWGSGGNQGGVSASNFALGIVNDSNGVWAQCYILGNSSTFIYALPVESWNTWMHIAFSRIGDTFNVWVNGQLSSQLTGISDSLTQTNVNADGFWLFTGPVGDRDQTYTTFLGCLWKNMRYVIGSSVYGNVNTFTPPSINVNIPTISGTQYIWYPNQDTLMGFQNSAVPPFSGPYPTNYQILPWEFYGLEGSTGSGRPITVLYSNPENQQLTLQIAFPVNSFIGGTWVNNGTNPNQPMITTNGPTPPFGTSCGDFSMSGTDVRISSTDSSLANFSSLFRLYIWVYIPATITNECKTILAVENSGGMVINIGRVGQDIDWLSISSFGGSELAYGKHIWARNAWNLICIQRGGNAPNPVAAWAGVYGQNYASNVNLIDTGAENFNFADTGTVSIGCTSGSTVSSEMFFNQILLFNMGIGQLLDGNIFPVDQATIPTIEVPSESEYTSLACCFDFQGTNGDTNIQPIGPT